MAFNNPVNANQQGTQYLSISGAWSGIDGSTVGSILTSNGTGVAPSFQPSTSNNPNAVVEIYDDFTSSDQYDNIAPSTTLITSNVWFPQARLSPIQPISGHPGIVTFVSLAVVSSPLAAGMFLDLANHSADLMVVGDGTVTLTWIINLAVLSNPTNKYNVTLGLQGQFSAAANNIFFMYSDTVNSGKWQISCSTTPGPTATTLDSGIVADTNWHNFTIVINSTGTSVSFYIDGVQTANSPITTNISPNGMTPWIILIATTGTIPQNTLLIDTFYYKDVLNNPR